MERVKTMHILVTNDDGVQAPGLLALAKAMRPFGKVSVLAPDHNWSISGHVKTLHRPLRVKETTLADGQPGDDDRRRAFRLRCPGGAGLLARKGRPGRFGD